MADKDNSALVGALMLVAGGIIGAGVALLVAPQSGKETREDIARYARRTRKRAGHMVEDFTDAFSDVVDTVVDKSSDILDKGKDLAADTKKEIMKAIEEGQDRLEREKKRLAKMFS